jgi:hypothetical protein
MSFLGLGPLEWALIAAITAIVVGIGWLPEVRNRARGDKSRR